MKLSPITQTPQAQQSAVSKGGASKGKKFTKSGPRGSRGGSPSARTSDKQKRGDRGTDSKKTDKDGTIRCYWCGKDNHLMADCYLKKVNKPKVPRHKRPPSLTVTYNLVCSFCNKKGHVIKDCWSKQKLQGLPAIEEEDMGLVILFGSFAELTSDDWILDYSLHCSHM